MADAIAVACRCGGVGSFRDPKGKLRCFKCTELVAEAVAPLAPREMLVRCAVCGPQVMNSARLRTVGGIFCPTCFSEWPDGLSLGLPAGQEAAPPPAKPAPGSWAAHKATGQRHHQDPLDFDY